MDFLGSQTELEDVARAQVVADGLAYLVLRDQVRECRFHVPYYTGCGKEYSLFFFAIGCMKKQSGVEDKVSAI